MSRIEELERGIRGLSAAELSEFREWFAEFDGAAWDRAFEADVASGRLDRVADRALEDYNAGRGPCPSHTPSEDLNQAGASLAAPGVHCKEVDI